MAITITDEVMLREPNLWEHWKLPVGPVKIDWTNPLTEKLRKVFIFRNGSIFELVKNTRPTSNTGTSTTGSPGQGFYYSGSTYTQVPHVTDIGFGDGTGLETIAAMVIDGGPTNGYIYCCGNTTDPVPGTNPIIGIYSDSNVAKAISRGDSGTVHFNISGTTNINDGDPHLIVCAGSRLSGGTAYLYVDGVQEASASVSTETQTLNSESIGALVRSTVGAYYTGKVFLAANWDRQMSAAEVKSFSSDPFQFLIPA